MKSKIFILTITGLVAIILIASCIKKSQTDIPIEWTCVTESAPWAPRRNHTAVVYDNKIWVVGGYSNRLEQPIRNDVWFSSDGVNWNCATESAGWLTRSQHTSVVFDNKIWILGGRDTSNYWSWKNDVWFSSDGINWTCATDSAEWSARGVHTAVVFDNKIWVIGGWDTIPTNDVWFSNDGINWNCATESAQWSPRCCFTSVVFENKMWILGGRWQSSDAFNDVWYSNDGYSWVCATDSAGWSDRMGHTSIIFNDIIWVIGGCAKRLGGAGPSSDVWFSHNGEEWICTTDSAPWRKREYFPSVVFDNKLWILGGTPSCMNDVWYGEIVHGKR